MNANMYRIESAAGIVIGEYCAIDRADALDEMAAELGYDDYAECVVVTGEGDLIVTEITGADYPV